MLRGTKHVIAIFVVFAIFKFEREREQTEREQRKPKNSLRAPRYCGNLDKDSFFLVLTLGLSIFSIILPYVAQK